MHPPADLNAWGNSAGWMPAGSPVATELPRWVEIGARIQFGGWSALQETAFGAVTFGGLTMVTFGGYASYTGGSAIWGGDKEFGVLGALNALNPLYHLATSVVDTFAAAEHEDWEAVGQGGVKTGVAALGVVGAVAGIAGAARGAAAAQRAARGAAGAGAPRAYSVAYETTIPKLGLGTRASHFESANRNLLRAMAEDPELAALVKSVIPEFESSVLSFSGTVRGFTARMDRRICRMGKILLIDLLNKIEEFEPDDVVHVPAQCEVDLGTNATVIAYEKTKEGAPRELSYL